MNDETKAELMKRTREWLQSCINAATRSGVPEEADLEAFILAHLDGEPARLAAALENLREAGARRVDAVKCYGYGVEADEPGVRDQCAGEVRDTPLDATPLRSALERANEGVRYWTDLAQAEAQDAAALRARVAELEAELERERMRLAACGIVAQANTPESAKAAREMHADYRSASCDDVAAAVDREMALRAERDRFSADAADLRSKVGTLKAHLSTATKQVAAARAECQEILKFSKNDPATGAAEGVLRAMDEAAK